MRWCKSLKTSPGPKHINKDITGACRSLQELAETCRSLQSRVNMLASRCNLRIEVAEGDWTMLRSKRSTSHSLEYACLNRDRLSFAQCGECWLLWRVVITVDFLANCAVCSYMIPSLGGLPGQGHRCDTSSRVLRLNRSPLSRAGVHWQG